MHSKDRATQEVALPLFEQFSDPRTTVFACRHRALIARFLVFTHRNSALGWVSSEPELAFLQRPATPF